MNGQCDGTGSCQLYAAATSCGTCSQCNGGGSCNQTPADDAACGTIHCDALNTTCRTYTNLTTNRCASLGTCKPANPTNCVTYNNTAGTTSCGLCEHCDGSGGCTATPADDASCGTINCASLNTACATYTNLTSNRCKSFGTCKSANTTDCGIVTYGGTGVGCGTCKHCDGSGGCVTAGAGTGCATCKTCDASGGCTQNIGAGASSGGACATQAASTCGTTGNCDGSGGCQKWAAATACGLCSQCNGSGACNQMPADDPACNTINCASLDTTCRTYTNLTTNRCKALGTCKGANTTDCTTFNNTTSGTHCGTCQTCDGAGSCANVADGTDPNNDCPGSQICCAGACAHRADGGGCP